MARESAVGTSINFLPPHYSRDTANGAPREETIASRLPFLLRLYLFLPGQLTFYRIHLLRYRLAAAGSRVLLTCIRDVHVPYVKPRNSLRKQEEKERKKTILGRGSARINSHACRAFISHAWNIAVLENAAGRLCDVHYAYVCMLEYLSYPPTRG